MSLAFTRRSALRLGVPAALTLTVPLAEPALAAAPASAPLPVWLGAWPDDLRAAVTAAMPTAVDQARRAAYPFGAVLVDVTTGSITLGAGNSSDTGDRTSHAETHLLRLAAAEHVDLTTQAIVTTAEPCAMCTGAILWSGVAAVAYGTSVRTLIALGITQIAVDMPDLVARWTGPGAPLQALSVRPDLTDPLYRNFPH